jgi:carbamoyl-phosphate synthase large subunit
VAAIERIIAEQEPDLVIPGRDDDILVLARMKPLLAEKPVLMVGSVAGAEIMNDKKRTCEFAERHGLPFAPTVDAPEPALALAAAHGYPLIGKPRCGNGARGVTILRNEAELVRAFARRPDLVVQPFLDFPADGADLLGPFDAGLPFFFSFPERAQYLTHMIIGPDGSFSETSVIRNLQVGGQAIRTEKVEDEQLLDLARRYGEAMRREGWVGPVNTQSKRAADGRFVSFEMNGRFGGGTAARTQHGYDEVGIAIRAFLPGVQFPGFPEENCNVVLKSLTSFALPVRGLEQLRRTGKWERSPYPSLR